LYVRDTLYEAEIVLLALYREHYGFDVLPKII